MAFDLSNTLVVGISATALFDMSESDRIFTEARNADPATAVEVYQKDMLEREDETLAPGTGYHLVKALLALNEHKQKGDTSPLVEIVMPSTRPRLYFIPIFTTNKCNTLLLKSILSPHF